jgi:hypothetical protein
MPSPAKMPRMASWWRRCWILRPPRARQWRTCSSISTHSSRLRVALPRYGTGSRRDRDLLGHWGKGGRNKSGGGELWTWWQQRLENRDDGGRRQRRPTGRFGSILGSTGHDPICPSIVWVRFDSTRLQISGADRVRERFEPHPF